MSDDLIGYEIYNRVDMLHRSLVTCIERLPEVDQGVLEDAARRIGYWVTWCAEHPEYVTRPPFITVEEVVTLEDEAEAMAGVPG